jgi:hypothetical protein
MSTIIDPELTVRLGALHPDQVVRIHDYATAAFLWRGMRQAEALEVARGLHWRAVGLDPGASSAELVTALSLHPLDDPERDRLAGLLDVQCRLDHGYRSGDAPGERPGLDDFRRLGRRLSLALALVDTTQTIA